MLSRSILRTFQIARCNFGSAFSTTASDGVLFRPPELPDAKAMYDIVVNGTLDNNSAYAYMIFAKHFRDTCIVAEEEGNVLGFIKGYRPPTSPEAVFVWQVGVHEAARGRKIAGRMLNALVDRLRPAGVDYVEATVTPSNAPSRKLFRGLARDRGVECVESPFFAAEDFPHTEGSPAHEGEDYFRIGPFPKSQVSSTSGGSFATGQQRRAFHSSPRNDFIIRTFEDVAKSGQVHKAASGTWESRRYLLRKDGLGFSFHHTILYKGSSTLIWYRNHVEAVMIVKGSGEIEIVQPGQKEGEGKVHKLEPFTMYALNGQERHFLRASPNEDMHVVCAFNPPIAGTEDHNEHGVYPAVGDDGVPIYELMKDHIENLTVPPESLKEGTPSTDKE